jgi:hypothetical protein
MYSLMYGPSLCVCANTDKINLGRLNPGKAVGKVQRLTVTTIDSWRFKGDNLVHSCRQCSNEQHREGRYVRGGVRGRSVRGLDWFGVYGSSTVS